MAGSVHDLTGKKKILTSTWNAQLKVSAPNYTFRVTQACLATNTETLSIISLLMSV